MATVTAGYTWTSGETVTPAKLNSAAAPTVAVANDEITTAKILDANVTAAKLASNAVETAKIADDAVTNDKLSLAANAGEIKKALNADNSPPIYACRAWVNFDGTAGSTVGGEFRCTIRGSANVSKVVRNATGQYTIHFTTNMPDANYCIVTHPSADGFATWMYSESLPLADQCGVSTVSAVGGGAAYGNRTVVHVAIFR
jgi:hypothetical protein